MANTGRILVVDDNIDLCHNLADILEDMNYDVRLEHSGDGAVDAIRKEKFDVVLMDIKMPYVNGVDAYRRMREMDDCPSVVMMTAFTTDELVRDALREGVFAVLYKPLDMDILLNSIEESRESGRLILIVDDNAELCVNLADILQGEGYRAVCVHSAEQALEAARSNNADVFLIDLKLPTSNGLDVYLALKDIRPDATAIMITAYADELPHLVEGSLAHGAYTCLKKPIDCQVLSEILSQVLANKK